MNPQPSVLETDALPVELHPYIMNIMLKIKAVLPILFQGIVSPLPSSVSPNHLGRQIVAYRVLPYLTRFAAMRPNLSYTR